MLDTEQVVIARGEDGAFRLKLQEAAALPLRISPSLSPEHPSAQRFDFGGEVALRPLAAGRRHYFHLMGDDFHGVVAERHIPFQGTPNFRDFGGYRTEDGRRLRWGWLYRSGQLAGLDDTDSRQLGALGIGLVCDFRRDEERAKEPSRFSEDEQPRVEGLPISPGSATGFFTALEEGRASVEQMVAFMEEINRDFALAQIPTYRRMFELLLETDTPVLVHCAAGKDRTGFAAAMILRALGVSRELVLQDYLLTTRYLRPEAEVARLQRKYGFEGNAEVLIPMLEARASYLSAAFAAIDETFGDDERYLAESLGVTRSAREALREKLLLPVGVRG